MLLLVRIGLVFAVVVVNHIPLPVGEPAVVTGPKVGFSFGALKRLVDPVGGPWEMSALGVNHTAIRIGEGQDVVIKNLPMILSGTHGTSTCTLCFDWIAIFGPVGHVNVVHMLLHDMVPAEPVEVVPITHLILHLRLARSPWLYPNTPIVPIYLTADNIAKGSVLDTLHGFPIVVLVVTLQTYYHVEFFGLGYLSSS